MAVRFHCDNRITASGVTLDASSYQSSLPTAYLLDQLHSKVWRSLEGYNVVAGFNDDLDFVFSGTKVATLTAGNYATPALYAAQVQTALLAAGLTGATCTYSSATGKFTLAATGAFSLPWSTGTNAATSCGKDLGFDTTADDGSATSHVADNQSYHSREWIVADLGSALSGQSLILKGHNVLSGGVVKVQANASDSWGSPSVDQTLAAGTDIRVSLLSSAETYRYWRLLMEDVANDDAYTEAGVWYVGPHREPTVNHSQGHRVPVDDLSAIETATGGAHFVDERSRRKGWELSWEEISDADQALLDGIGEDMPSGRCFFMTLDPTGAPAETIYGFLPDQPGTRHAVGDWWDLSLTFLEALE